MWKLIKRSIKYLIILAGIAILLPTMFYLLLQIPLVQTLMVRRVTNHFSDELKSSISVGSINYKFFNKLVIKEVLIKDQNNDTLIYSEEIDIVIKSLNLKNKSIMLGSVALIKPEISLITDTTGVMNLNWYLDQIKNPADSTAKSKSKFSVGQIDIRDGSFALINRNSTKSKNRIDLNNLKIEGINGIVEDVVSADDTTSLNIYSLSFREKSGFNVRKLSSSVVIAKNMFGFNSTYLNCDSSIINISKFSLKADSADSFKRFAEEVKIDLRLEKSLISTSELKYFLPFADKINESLWLSGKISGTISELRGRNLFMTYRDYTSLDFDFDLSGLPSIDNAFIYIGINSLITNAKDLENINIPGKGNIIVPEVLYKVGNISFDGTFTGFITDFVTYGKLRTRLGSIRTDISMRPEASNVYRIKGLITGNEIDLGELTGKTDLLGKMSIHANVDGSASSLKKFATNLSGIVDSVEINSYKYRNISMNGFFTEKTWDGSIKVADKNIKLDFLGMFNFGMKLPEFDFTLNLAEANLFNLNIDKLDTSASLTMLLTSNFRGNNIDNLDGEIRLLNSTYKKYNNSLNMYDYSVRTFTENNRPVLSLRTDIVDADIRGYYNFATLGELARSVMGKLMPSQFPVIQQRKNIRKNNFSFEINLKNTDRINNFFRTGILIADKSFIQGSVFPDSLMNIHGKSESLSIMNNVFKDFDFDVTQKGSELTAGIKCSSLAVIKQTELKGFSIGLQTRPDNFVFTVYWDNKDNNLNKGNIVAKGQIDKSSSTNKNSKLIVNIDSTVFYTKGNRWNISQSSVAIDSSAISIHKLYMTSTDRYYLVDGTVSVNPADTLYLKFNGIEISPLNYLVGNQNDPTRVPFDFAGRASGKILLNNVYKDFLLESDLNISDFSVLKSKFGTLYIRSDLDNTNKVVNIKARNDLGGVKMLDIEGFYNRQQKKLDLNAKAIHLPVDGLNPLLKVFASGINGTASGKVNFTAQREKLMLRGALMAENTTMKIDYLQAKFKMNDTVRFDKNGIKFNNIKLTDEKGNFAMLNGSVNHKSFKEYTADLTINIAKPNECLVLNTKPKDNELFYGTTYASGVTTIKAGPGFLTFDISAKTGRNTKFYMPLTSGLSVAEYSFISFAKPDSTDSQKDETRNITATITPAKTLMDLNFDLEVTPEAEAQLIFDSRVGDVMKGRGSGKLNINYNRKGEFTMSGDYIIEQGDYLFTLGNIFNKSFTVESGGKIMFNGDMDNAEIDMKAIYKLKTSLMPLLQDPAYNNRIDVQCQLNLTGKLFNPVVGLAIELPNSDEQTKAYVRNSISTEEELSRQFLYLLVMNSFYADPAKTSSANTTASSGSSGTEAMAVTTTEMLSNQLSNWLSQLNKDLDIGLNYRPGTKDLSSQDVQVALSTQLLNDKVVINGNFDYRDIGGNSVDAGKLTGDFDFEVTLTDKIKLKVFNRFNNTYSGKGPYTQGIGVFYKEEFDKFSDLFKKKIKSDMKKEEEPVITGKDAPKNK